LPPGGGKPRPGDPSPVRVIPKQLPPGKGDGSASNTADPEPLQEPSSRIRPLNGTGRLRPEVKPSECGLECVRAF
jgi:hypothetical protein